MTGKFFELAANGPLLTMPPFPSMNAEQLLAVLVKPLGAL